MKGPAPRTLLEKYLILELQGSSSSSSASVPGSLSYWSNPELIANRVETSDQPRGAHRDVNGPASHPRGVQAPVADSPELAQMGVVRISRVHR